MNRLCPLLLMAAACSTVAIAAEYPTKPIHIIVAGPPGGGSDIPVRLLQPKLVETLHQPIVIDNRPGAAGRIGSEAAAKAAPDGYTLLVVSTAFSINPSLYKHLPYDAVHDFVAVASLMKICNALVVTPSLPVGSVKALIQLAKAHPGELEFASGGTGTGNHLSGELFKAMTGIKMLHVPYKGATLALTDVISGQVPVMFPNLPPAIPFIRAKRLRALAVTCATRSPFLPGIPTVAEAGVPGYEADGWFGIVAPRGTPESVTARLNKAINDILGTESFRKHLAAVAAEPFVSSPADFEKHIRSEITKWAGVVKAAGLVPR